MKHSGLYDRKTPIGIILNGQTCVPHGHFTVCQRGSGEVVVVEEKLGAFTAEDVETMQRRGRRQQRQIFFQSSDDDKIKKLVLQ